MGNAFARCGLASRSLAAAGLALPGRLFLNDHALRGARRSTWLGVVAHELTHLAQYELSGGRRGRSEQWLREGMAEWVTSRVLEGLGEGAFRRRREQARRAVARGLSALREEPLDVADAAALRAWLPTSGHSATPTTGWTTSSGCLVCR